MPSVPMPMPSVTVGKPNTCGIAPAALSAAIARSTSGWMPALHGFIVLWPLATPTIGFSKSRVAEADGAQHRAIGRAGDALRDESASGDWTACGILGRREGTNGRGRA